MANPVELAGCDSRNDVLSDHVQHIGSQPAGDIEVADDGNALMTHDLARLGQRNIAAALLSFAPSVISHGGNSIDTRDEDGLLLSSPDDVVVVCVSVWKAVREVVVCG